MNTKACVLSTSGDTAVVKAFKQSACAGCTGCNDKTKCHTEFMLAELPDSFELEVKNDVGAKTGDVVEIMTDSKISLFLAFFTFVIPVIFTLIGYYVADNMSNNDNVSLLVSTVTFIVSFVICSILSNKLSSKLSQSWICKIIKENGGSRCEN